MRNLTNLKDLTFKKSVLHSRLLVRLDWAKRHSPLFRSESLTVAQTVSIKGANSTWRKDLLTKYTFQTHID
jgi:hypothetical protein